MMNLTEYRVSVNVGVSRCLSVSRELQDKTATGSTKYKWIDDMLTALKHWLRNASDQISTAPQELSADCEKSQVYNWNASVNLQTITFMSLIVLTLLVGLLLITICVRLFVGKQGPGKETLSCHVDFDVQTVGCGDDLNCQHISKTEDMEMMKPMKIFFNAANDQNFYTNNLMEIPNDIGNFLQKTVSLLYAEVDRLIIRTGSQESSPDFPGQTSFHSRRSSLRRIRVSSPSLSGNSGIENDNDNRIDMEPWREVIRMAHKLDWKIQCQYQITDLNESSSSFLNGYYRENCLVPPDQWDASCLIVNYVLVLLQKGLCGGLCREGLRFVEFISSGSAKRGLKIKAASQFDIHMCLRYSSPLEIDVLYNGLCTEVPPGKLLLCVEERQKHHAHAAKVNIGDDDFYCLSHQKFLSAAHELIDSTIDSIYSKFRSLLDRLHFQIEKAHTANIVVNVNTKNIIGIGLKDIRIRIIPAVLCPVSGVFGPCSLYAVPPWIYNDQKGRRPSVGNVNDLGQREVFWSISCLELQDFYHGAINRQLRFTNAPGCHEVCGKILKSLFGAGERKSLINRGELSSYQIETVVCFMLLESSPKQWSMACLPRRFSDCYQFLKKAISCCRLPDFFLHNPHLTRQMTWLDMVPAVSGGRQNNLFKDMTNEVAEKVLNFMEEQLAESGLQDCIQEYSSDMWEYEFFVFN